MKAIVLKDFGSTDHFELIEMEDPVMQENEVLVQIKASSFNPIDYQMRQGATESKLLKSPVLGRELSGIVIATGKQVTDFFVGDAVTAYVGSLTTNGTYAELISIPMHLIAKNPQALSFAEAAALPMAGMTALQCFQRLILPADKPLLITGGAGGVGTMLIKLLLASGQTHIITTAGNEQSKTHLRALGINENHIVDYRQPHFPEILQSKSADGTFDHIIDLVGGTMSEISATLLNVHGTYVDVTFQATANAKEMLFDKATTIINVANYAYALTGKRQNISFYGSMLTVLFDKITQQLIAPPAIHILGPLEVGTVKKAHQLMEENKTMGKKLIMINGS